MSLMKAIEHGKEYRRKSFKPCPNRSCPYCMGSHLHSSARRMVSHTAPEDTETVRNVVARKVARRALW